MPADQNQSGDPSVPDMKDVHPAPLPGRDVLRSVTRLVVGGIELGSDELLRRLAIWENEVGEFEGTRLSIERSSDTPPRPSSARLALIGLLFEMQDGVLKSARKAGKVERIVTNWLQPLLQPIIGSRMLRPTRRQFERLVSRGKTEVERWIQRGEYEETHSRVLAEKGFDDIVDTYIEYLASNPEVQELVQTQSSGLANEVIEEVRERTVSADTFLEGLARSLLRRLPRASLPPPPQEVRTHAASLRHGKKGPPGRQ